MFSEIIFEFSEIICYNIITVVNKFGETKTCKISKKFSNYRNAETILLADEEVAWLGDVLLNISIRDIDKIIESSNVKWI